MDRSYEEWLGQVAASIVQDPLSSFETCRKALFLADLAWCDVEKLFQDARGKAIAGQLLDAAGSLPANIEEGFGRGYGKDNGRLLRIALGSARETRGWCHRSRHLFDPALLDRGMKPAGDLISGLVTAARQQYNR